MLHPDLANAYSVSNGSVDQPKHFLGLLLMRNKFLTNSSFSIFERSVFLG